MTNKAPLVFLDYDQQALDAAYDQAAYAFNREQLIRRRDSDSAAARARLGEPERLAYGGGEIEQLDLYRAAGDRRPLFVFIHGGAWRAGRAAEYASPAEMFADVGAHYVVPDFNWVQDAGGNLMVLADQVRRAIAWVYRNAARFGGDPSRLYLGGQSSGGHLAAVAMTTDWSRQFELPADIIKGGLLVSGMYELAPVRLSKRSAYVAFDDACVEALKSDPPSRPTARTCRYRLRHLRDPGIPAPESRVCRSGRSRRQAGAVIGRRALQSLRIARDPRQSLWAVGAGGARTDGTAILMGLRS